MLYTCLICGRIIPCPRQAETSPAALRVEHTMDYSPSEHKERPASATRVGVAVRERAASATSAVKMRIESFSLSYGTFRAVKDVTLPIAERHVTAIIGPSGCGKSTLLRSINRMNDLIPGVSVQGAIRLNDKNIYDPDVVGGSRGRQSGMVFHRPTPFPKPFSTNVPNPLR